MDAFAVVRLPDCVFVKELGEAEKELLSGLCFIEALPLVINLEEEEEEDELELVEDADFVSTPMFWQVRARSRRGF